jgi:hypothetical protein
VSDERTKVAATIRAKFPTCVWGPHDPPVPARWRQVPAEAHYGPCLCDEHAKAAQNDGIRSIKMEPVPWLAALDECEWQHGVGGTR